jgi:hypothetical protein
MLRQQGETDGGEFRTEAPRCLRRSAMPVEEAAHTLDVAHRRSDPECTARAARTSTESPLQYLRSACSSTRIPFGATQFVSAPRSRRYCTVSGLMCGGP